MNKKGFTLIEVIISIVLVSVVLISLLATLVKLRETYTIIHENTDVLVYSSSITRVINNDFIENNGIRYISCNAEGSLCDMIMGNDEKRQLEIRRDTTTRTEKAKTEAGKSENVTIEDIKTSLKYSNTTKYDKTGNESDKELIYIRTLELEKATNETTKITTTDGYNFTLMEKDQQKYKKSGTNLVDVVTTIKIKLDDGKSTELSQYDIVLYASGRYDESKIVGERYTIALDYGEATTSGTTSIDEIYGVSYYEINPVTSSENRIEKITAPTRLNYAFLGYYYKRNGSNVEEQVIDTTGKIIADTRTFQENITKDPTATSRVYAKWHECTNYPGYEVINGVCTPKKYQVTLDQNEGKNGTEYYTATYQAWVQDVTIPQRGGYVFTGYKSSTGKTFHNNEGKGQSVYDIPNDATFTAGWDACPAGTYSPENKNECIKCPEGTYGDTEGLASCKKCPAGTYQGEQGQIKCLPCAAGTYNTTEGNTTCKICEAGKYCTGRTNNTNCPKNTYRNTTGGKKENDCTPCASGYASDPGSIKCRDVEPPKCSVSKTVIDNMNGVTTKVTCTDNSGSCTLDSTGDTKLKSGKTYNVTDAAGNKNTCSTTVTSYQLCGLYKSCRVASCGVESYKTCRTSGCSCETYKSCEHKDCGYKSCRTSGCGCLTYNTCTHSNCGTERKHYFVMMWDAPCSNCTYGGTDVAGYTYLDCYCDENKTCANSACGCKTYKYCENSACGKKTCRTSACGCETYKSCEHKDCGVNQYKSCRKEACGCERYDTYYK